MPGILTVSLLCNLRGREAGGGTSESLLYCSSWLDTCTRSVPGPEGNFFRINLGFILYHGEFCILDKHR